MNMLTEGTAWISGQLKEHAGTDVVYSRGKLSVPLTATRPPPNHDLFVESGYRTEAESHFWTIAAADFVLGGQVTKPQVGDEITLGSGTARQVFLVANLDDGTPPYQSLDGETALITIFTKRIR